MQVTLRQAQAYQVRRGLFNIDINSPGEALKDRRDPRGFLQLGRFDDAKLYPGVFVAMHPHVDDEILTYVRAGRLIHEDTTGHRVELSPQRVMLMNAGRGFEHQESIPEDGEPVRLLQIFLRPHAAGLTPDVHFADLDTAYSIGAWRTVAGPAGSGAPLTIRSEARVLDGRFAAGATVPLLLDPSPKAYLLYVFSGQLRLGDETLGVGDSLLYADAQDTGAAMSAEAEADLVLFELDAEVPFSRAGMFSGR